MVDHLAWQEEKCVILREVHADLIPLAFVAAMIANKIIRSLVIHK